MQRYPLLFTFRDFVAGRGFVAFVETAGRAMLEREEDGCWMYGVNPGAIAAGAEGEPKNAMSEFRKAYRLTLQEMAAASVCFDEFREQVSRFFEQEDEDAVAWQKAVDDLRRTGEKVEFVETADAGAERSIKVILCDEHTTPEMNLNPFEEEPIRAAA